MPAKGRASRTRRGTNPATTRSAAKIRRDTEARLERQAASVPDGAGPEAGALINELRVHQIELEMQNEELRRTQSELEAARDQYAALYDRAPFGYLTLARNGMIVAANLTAATLLAIERGLLVGRMFGELISAADAEVFTLYRRGVFAAKPTPQGCELDLRRADGRSIRVHVDSVLDSPRMHSVLVDVTELRAAERALLESESRFRQIAAHIEDAFYFREPSGAISYMSPAFERIWWRPAATLAGNPDAWLDTVDDEDRERVQRAWVRMRNGLPISEVYRIWRADGALRWVHSRGFPIHTDDGAVIGSAGVVRDVTKERNREDAIRQAQKMEAVGTLAGGVAHNLSNALQAAMSFVRLVQRRDVDDARRDATLDRAVGAMQRGAAMIEQLMTFARKQAGELRLQPLDVDEVVRDAMGLAKTLLGGHIAVDVDTQALAGVVSADPVQMEQILLNLATNARDAMPAGGTLAVKTTIAVLDEATARAHGVVPGPHVIITVADTGSGMDAATKARIFEPFFTTKPVGDGIGLGLSTVFALVHQFGGCIQVDSTPGRGTRFTICFPALQSQVAETGATLHE